MFNDENNNKSANVINNENNNLNHIIIMEQLASVERNIYKNEKDR